MHPIERLRYVARASGVSQAVLVQETAQALASFAGDPHGLVTACQRVVSRQPSSGPLVWFAARVLTAGDPISEVWAAAGELQADPTAAELARALPDDSRVCVLGWPSEIGEALPRRGDVEAMVVDTLHEGAGFTSSLWNVDMEAADVPMSGLGAAAAAADLVVLEAVAIGPDTFLAVSGSRAAAAVAKHAGVPVWLVGGVGRLLPKRMFDGLRRRVETDEPWDADDEFVPLDLVDSIVGVAGPETVADALERCNCPVAPELFKGIVL
ncbi:MAG: hypothetical protein HYX32_05095 [Actinobacteria bacterium]|nr:hypothetical protein [Actinomycetota bacterium]